MQLLVRQLFTKVVSRASWANNNFRTYSFFKMAPVKVGDTLPAGELYEDSPANKINLAEYCSDKKVIIFGVPGAFTPGCSKTHVPSYIENYDKLKTEQKINDIICVAVNDPFVMSAWKKDLNADGKVRMLADPNATFAKNLNLTVDLPPLGGTRCKRFSMVVENGKITELNIEPDGTGLTCSLADKIGNK